MTMWSRLAPTLLLAMAGMAAALDEVPFVSTPERVARAMLEIALVGPGDMLIDLGSGDGRIVIAAARERGARAIGVEIDPALVERSRANAARAGVAQRVEFREQDLFKTDLAPATVITMYLLPDVNLALRPSLLALEPGTRIVSHDWDMADWPADHVLTLDVPDKAIGREKTSRVLLWVVPAPVAGLWCSASGRALRLQQQFQRAQGQAVPVSGHSVQVWGLVDGTTLHLASRGATLSLTIAGNAARVDAAAGEWSPWSGLQFTRTGGSACAP
jgi:SAM-dependent methyltransferase